MSYYFCEGNDTLFLNKSLNIVKNVKKKKDNDKKIIKTIIWK